MKLNFLFGLIFCCFLNLANTKAQTLQNPLPNAYGILVEQNFSAYSECGSSNPDPNFNYAELKFSDISGLKHTDEIRIEGESNLSKLYSFNDTYFWNNDNFNNSTGILVNTITLKGRTENVGGDGDMNRSFTLAIDSGSVSESFSLSEPCSNSFNWSGNREGYTMTTTLTIDDPIDLSADAPCRLSVASDLLALHVVFFSPNNYKEYELQVTRQDDLDWTDYRSISSVKSLLPQETINLSYEQIAGTKTEPDTKYFDWLSKGIMFRAVKRLQNGTYTYGKTISNVVFFPEGLQFEIDNIHRSSCNDSIVKINVTLENSEDRNYLDINTDTLTWKMGIFTDEDDEDGKAFYTCEFKELGDNKYEIIPTRLTGEGGDVDILNNPNITEDFYCELLLEEKSDIKYEHCLRSFTLPGKPAPVKINQKAPTDSVAKASGGYNLFHLLSDNDIYAYLELEDTYVLADQRQPYYIMDGTDTMAVIQDPPATYEENQTAIDAEFETHFDQMLEGDNSRWALYLDGKYTPWYNSIKDGVKYTETVPTMGHPNVSANGYSLKIGSPNYKYFAYKSGTNYYKLSFSFANGYSGKYLASSSTGDYQLLHNINNSGTITKVVNTVSSSISASTISTSNIVTGAGSKYLFKEISGNTTILKTLDLNASSVGTKTTIIGDGKLPLYSSDGSILLYTKSNGSGLYKYGEATALSSRDVRAINYIDPTNTYCIFQSSDYNYYKKILRPITINEILDLKSDTLSFPDMALEWLNKFKAIYKKQWLLETYGYRFSFNGMQANTPYDYHLIDSDGCPSTITNIYPKAESGIYVAVPEQPVISYTVLNSPSNACASNGRIRLNYASGGIDDYYYANDQLKIGGSLDISGLNTQDTLYFYNENSTSLTYIEYIDFSELTNSTPPLSTTSVACTNKYNANGVITVSLTNSSSESKQFILKDASNPQISYASSYTTESSYTFIELEPGSYNANVVFFGDCSPLALNNTEVEDQIFSLLASPTHSNSFSADGSVDITVLNRNNQTLIWGGDESIITNNGNFDNATFTVSNGTYTLNAIDEADNTDTISFTVEQPSFQAQAILTSYLDGENTQGDFDFSLSFPIRLGNQALTLKSNGITVGSSFGALSLRNLPIGNYELYLDTGTETELIYSFTIANTSINCTESIISPSCKGDSATVNLTATDPALNASMVFSLNGLNYDATGSYKTSMDTLNYFVQTSQISSSSFYSNTIAVTQNNIQQKSIAISQPSEVQGFIKTSDITCNGNSDGSISVTNLKGGIYNTTYAYRVDSISSWQDSTVFVSGLQMGSYQVFLKDDFNNCPEVNLGQVSINEPDSLTIHTIEIVQPSCELDNGAISVAVDGGNEAYTYNWLLNGSPFSTWIDDFTLDSTTVLGDSLQYGQYSLSVTDYLGCTLDTMLVLDQYINPYITKNSTIDAACYGDSNGSISVDSIQSNHHFEKVILLLDALQIDSAFSLPAIFTDLPLGNYQLSVSDTMGCQANQTLPVSINQPDAALSIVVDTIRPVLHKGEASAYIGTTTSGGNLGLKELVLKDLNDNTIDNLEAINGIRSDFTALPVGTYSIEAIDTKGCSTSVNTLVVEEPADFLSLQLISKEDALCKASIGSFSVQGVGGWGDYTYKRGTSQLYYTQNTFNSLYAGNYLISVQDKYGATYTDTIEIIEPQDSLKLNLLDVQLPSCPDNGSITLSATGGTAPYQLVLNEAEDSVTVGANESYAYNNLGVNNYSIQGIDANGCKYALETVLDNQNRMRNLQLVPTYPSNMGTSDGALTASFEGGQAPFSYSWSKDQTMIQGENNSVLNNQSSGFYQLIVSDALGCSISAQSYLANAYDKALVLSEKQDETAYLAANGYATFTFAEENYGTATLMNPDGILTYYTASQNAALFNANGLLELANLSGGDYSIQVVDVNGDTYFANFSIEPYQEFVFSLSSTSPALERNVANGSAQITVMGGAPNYSFSWVNLTKNTAEPSREEAETSFLENVNAGIYELTVSDRYNNTIQTQIEILEPQEDLQLSIDTFRHQTCKGYEDAFVFLSAKGGWGDYQFKSDISSGFANSSLYEDLNLRTYQFYLIDKYGITDSITFEVSEPDFLRTSLLATDSVSCNGLSDGAFEFDLNGGTSPYRLAESSYPNEWKNGVRDSLLSEGFYTYYFTDSNNCVGQDTLSVYLPQPDILEFAQTDITHTTCDTDNGQMVVAMQGGSYPYSYQWQNNLGEIISNDSIITGMQQNGYYRVDVYDYHNCHTYYEQVVNPSTIPLINSIATTPVLCYGDANGKAEVSAVTPAEPYAPYSFVWSNEQQGDSSTGWDSNMHFVTVIDTNQCESTAYFNIDSPDSLRVSVNAFKDAHCYSYNDGFIDVEPIGGVGNYRYLWSNGDTTTLADSLYIGDYQIQLWDGNNCSYSKSFTINEPNEALIDLGENLRICPGNVITIDGQDYPAYKWSTSENATLSDERYLTTGEENDYYLRVTNSIGCYAYDTINISIGNDALQADFLLSSEAELGDTLNIYELSNLPLDSLSWKYDQVAFTSLNDTTTADYILYLQTLEKGMYNLTLEAYSGGCVSKAIKQVEIMDADTTQNNLDGLGYQEPLISKLTVAPNPTDGNFSLLIELREEADINVDIYNVNEASKIDQRSNSGLKDYTLSYQLSGINSGVYLIIVTAQNERKQVKIIVN